MKDDERMLMERIRTYRDTRAPIRAIAEGLGIPSRRAAYICDKWTRKGWYDYGVNVLAGWLTDEGRQVDLT